MRILFVNQFYWPDMAATAQQLSDLAELLAERGHDVHVLCSRGKYDDGSGGGNAADEERHGVRIHRLRAPGLGKSHFLDRLADYGGFHALTAGWLARYGPRFEVIVTLTTPPLIGIHATPLKRLAGNRVKHVCWSMDLHPDCEFELGMWDRNRPWFRALDWLNGEHFRQADATVALGEHMAERLRRKGVPDELLHVISVWSREDEVRPMPLGASPLRAEHELEDKLVVMYSGNAGLLHTFDALCEAMWRLRDDDRIRFVFVGGGNRLEEVQRFVDERGLSNFLRLPYFPREQLDEALGMGDVHLVTLRPEMTGVALPCKTYGIMAAARPVLFVGPEHSDTADHVRAGDAGMVVAPDDAAGLVDSIRMLADAPELARSMGKRGREYVLRAHERAVCCGQWVELLESFA